MKTKLLIDLQRMVSEIRILENHLTHSVDVSDTIAQIVPKPGLEELHKTALSFGPILSKLQDQINQL